MADEPVSCIGMLASHRDCIGIHLRSPDIEEFFTRMNFAASNDRGTSSESNRVEFMPTSVDRRTVDLSQYPNLVVIYLGMRVNRLAGLKTLFGFGPKISASVAAQPKGLLLHENFVMSLFPMHVGMRQYWTDMESLLSWSRSEPHRAWWKNFLRDSGGTGFWHETYLMQGGMEAIYDDVQQPIGFMRFAPLKPARGSMFGAASRAASGRNPESVVLEEDLYGK
jgi:hypothetical protein